MCACASLECDVAWCHVPRGLAHAGRDANWPAVVRLSLFPVRDCIESTESLRTGCPARLTTVLSSLASHPTPIRIVAGPGQVRIPCLPASHTPWISPAPPPRPTPTVWISGQVERLSHQLVFTPLKPAFTLCCKDPINSRLVERNVVAEDLLTHFLPTALRIRHYVSSIRACGRCNCRPGRRRTNCRGPYCYSYSA